MKRTATAVLALLLLAAPNAAAAATTVPTPAPTSTPVECDTALERPAVWDPVTGEVILCESRGEGPAMGPDCEVLGDCPPQLPMPPALPIESAEPAPPAATEPLAPVVHDELAETGLYPTSAMLLAFALGSLFVGCVAVAVLAARRAVLERKARRRT